MPSLTVILAGAGSGKTYRIQQQLADWVKAGIVKPERIVAVTFTEAAAAELRQRVSTELLDNGQLKEALRLDQAYISTIHGFGLRILTEFAFEASSSPQPRLLNEDEKNALIRQALSSTEKANEVISNLAAYGYSHEFNTQKSAEDKFRDDLLRIVELLHSLGWQTYSDIYASQAAAWISDSYGPTLEADALSYSLRKSVEVLLEAYPTSLEQEYGNNKTAANAFSKNFQDLKRSLIGDSLDTDWNLWEKLRGLRQSMRRSKIPEMYDTLSSAVKEAANQLPLHPGPLEHAKVHVQALFSAGQEVLVHYAEAKQEAGLVDYSDMIAMAGQLLRSRSDVRDSLKQRVDCLIVDEFQDTNPLQFDLLWQLKTVGIPTILVGDLKQAIMGFQGADPRLFESLIDQHPAETQPLTQNWRSQPRLMNLFNALGPGLFGEEYVTLDPRRTASRLEPLDIVSFPSKAEKDQHKIRAITVGERLKTLLNDSNQQIKDERTKKFRRLSGGDIAVLCPTNSMLNTYAEVLRAQGLRVRLHEDGWFTSRIVQLVWHALSYLANPGDRHAALYLAVTELGSLSLQEALTQLMDQGSIDDPLLDRLGELAEGVAERNMHTVVADSINTLGLFDKAALWTDGDQARANVLRLLAMAGEFMDANREALTSGGFHGSGIQSFMAWVSAKRKEKDGDKQPDARVFDENAIQLTTWHSAKGREWPVVAVCGLDREIKARLPNFEMGYSDFDDLSGLLKRAYIEYSPNFAASETKDRFLKKLQLNEEIEARRELYVALTRARDKIVLEWPGYLVRSKSKSPTFWSILKGGCGITLGEQSIQVGEQEFTCTVIEDLSELPDDFDDDTETEDSALPVTGRRAIQVGVVPKSLTADSLAPSTTEAITDRVRKEDLLVERYGSGLDVGIDLTGRVFGTFIHRCFEILGARPDIKERITQITGVEIEKDDLEKICFAVGQFESWLEDHFGGNSVLREQSILALDEHGSVIYGTVDLIVETSKGVWVIDHKSDQVDDPTQEFTKYQSQLESYAVALSKEGKSILGIAINWIRRGEVSLQALGTH
ncbi:MAG: UvrD-helicase domain-containing protein [Gammaproteobacteria bacterium]|nr:UvrD-helicase domain-containing protein [Gammaproteobacteria bacterium]